MNNENLKTSVEQVIKSNGNEEITGPILQSTLKTIINHFGGGGIFAGIAVPETIPKNSDLNQFYIANANGVYVNFGGYKNEGNNLVIFGNNTGIWQNIAAFPITNIQNIVDPSQLFPTEGLYNDAAETPALQIEKRIDFNDGYDVNYSIDATWYDGTPITDARVDDDIFVKIDGVFKRKLINKKSLLKINTIADLRLQNGYYEGQEITLLGYYSSGDKQPLNYKFTIENFSTNIDDGGSIIKSSKGTWIAQFNDAVDIRDFGAKSDGDELNYTGTDNKDYINKSLKLASERKLKLIINGKFKTTPIIFNLDNLDIVFKVGSYLIGGTDYIWSDRLFNISGKNINIDAYGSFIKMPNTFTTGEDRHCVNINAVENLTIKGLKTIGGGGDGFYIGNIGVPPKKVKLIDVEGYNPRRNGISLINGIDIEIIRPITELANGTYPMSGIDIEPNGHSTQEQLIGIKIIDPITRNNNGHGILVTPQALLGGSSLNPIYTDKQVDIEITGHTSYNDGWDGQRGGFGITGRQNLEWGAKMSGIIKYQGVCYNSGGPGFSFSGWSFDKAPKCSIDIYIENPASNIQVGSPNNYKTGVIIDAGASTVYDIGNLDLKVKVVDNRPVTSLYIPIYLYTTTRKLKKTTIAAEVEAASTFSAANYPMVNLGVFEGEMYYPKSYNIAISSTNTNDVRHWLGAIVSTTGAIGSTLPLSNLYIGQKVTFKNVGVNYQNIKLTSGDKFLDSSSNSTSDIILNIGQEVTFRAESTGWRVIYSSDKFIRHVFNGGDQPKDMVFASTTPTSGVFKKGDVIWNTSTTGNAGWICITGGDFALTPPVFSVFGMLGATKATSQPNSTATDIGSMVTDFNLLLSKLKNSGLMS